MKPGDRVIWLYSPGRSFLSGWRLQEILGVIVRICKHRIRLKVFLGGVEKLINVDPENVIWEEEARSLEETALDSPGNSQGKV